MKKIISSVAIIALIASCSKKNVEPTGTVSTETAVTTVNSNAAKVKGGGYQRAYMLSSGWCLAMDNGNCIILPDIIVSKINIADIEGLDNQDPKLVAQYFSTDDAKETFAEADAERYAKLCSGTYYVSVHKANPKKAVIHASQTLNAGLSDVEFAYELYFK